MKKDNGEVYVMGYNGNGECGMDNNVSNVDQPTFLLKDENIISVCCGRQHSFILTSKKKKIFFIFYLMCKK